MTGRFKKSLVKDNEYLTEKRHSSNSKNKDEEDEEIRLVERKLESEKARRRTRGPYRKSLVN